ncbi:MAG TPA: hypothetical protein VKQ09_06115 [Sphingomonas sp.]|nr:hypothetical protein [Sphingomonas sp.]
MSASKLVGIIGLIVVLCAWGYIALTGAPRLQVGIANGAYVNRCCGTVVLNNGIMTVANQRIGYVIERDKAGPYVLPKTYVGASATGFVIKPDAYALKLHLDDPTHPHQIELLDDGPTGDAFPFMQKSGS